MSLQFIYTIVERVKIATVKGRILLGRVGGRGEGVGVLFGV